MPQFRYQNCIDICQECHDVCMDTFANFCLQKGGMHLLQKHVKCMLDCIQICETAVDFMQRNSTNAETICEFCAEVCDDCAESCEMMSEEEMKNCVRICRQCAKTCRDMGGQESPGQVANA